MVSTKWTVWKTLAESLCLLNSRSLWPGNIAVTPPHTQQVREVGIIGSLVENRKLGLLETWRLDGEHPVGKRVVGL